MKTIPPRWDMSSIFSSFDGDDFKNACAKCVDDVVKLEYFLEDEPLFNDNKDFFEQWLTEYFSLFNPCGAMLASIATYTQGHFAVDTGDAKAIAAIGTLEEIQIQLEQVELRFREILAKNADLIDATCKQSNTFKDYAYILQEEAFFAEKQMSPDLEKLASDMQRTGGNAWGRLQEQIISHLIDQKTGATFNQIRNDAYSPDENVRKSAYETEIALLKSMEIPLAAALSSIKGESILLEKKVDWESSLQKSCMQSRISEKTLNALISSIEKSLPMWRDYLQTKAKLLGKESLDFCDMFAPLQDSTTCSKGAVAESLVSREWEFSEAKEYIIEKFTGFSQEMGDFAKHAFENNWIDAEVRKGKVGGAFCAELPYHKETRILSNFTGTFSDISTLAHELGHAYHQSCVENLDYSLIQYPMTLAETASTFCETIIQKDVIRNTDGFDKISIIEMGLQDSCQILVDILSRFYFEKSVFEKRQDGEIGASDFCSLMLEAQEKSYGDGLAQKHEYMWAVKSHYYSPSLHFYNYPYAFGQLFSTALYARYLKEGESFAETYKNLLADTGRLSCEEVCKNAGFDIETEAFWDSGIELYKNDLVLLKDFVNKYTIGNL